jgi:hypothetical protein
MDETRRGKEDQTNQLTVLLCFNDQSSICGKRFDETTIEKQATDTVPAQVVSELWRLESIKKSSECL